MTNRLNYLLLLKCLDNYSNEIRSGITQYFITACDDLAEKLALQKGKCTTPGYLAAYGEAGKKQYEYELKTLLGFEEFDVDATERIELAEYWWEDHDPMNWSDFDPIVYSVTYKGELVGYVQFGYRGYDTYPNKEEIEKLIVLLLDDIDTIPEDYSMNDVEYEFCEYNDMNDELPWVEEN